MQIAAIPLRPASLLALTLLVKNSATTLTVLVRSDVLAISSVLRAVKIVTMKSAPKKAAQIRI